MKKKDIKTHMGEVRSIAGNLKLLHGRLSGIEREGNFLELAIARERLYEAQEEVEFVIFAMESMVKKD